MTDEQRLIEKLRRIEALFNRPGTEGERQAASNAADRLRQRLDETRDEQLTEFQFSMSDAWSKALFMALLRRRNITPYRYSRQRRTTVMVKAPESVINNEIWPEFEELNKTLNSYLDEVTQRVIKAAIHGDVSEPEVRSETKGLPAGTT